MRTDKLLKTPQQKGCINPRIIIMAMKTNILLYENTGIKLQWFEMESKS